MGNLCKDCHEPLRGRSDKKFCNDGCRSNYHNQHNSEKLKDIGPINKILKANLKLLNQLNPYSKRIIPKQLLLDAGVNLKYHTHLHKQKDGKVLKFCYHQGYMELEDEKIQLIKMK